jgi:hypothetical protein
VASKHLRKLSAAVAIWIDSLFFRSSFVNLVSYESSDVHEFASTCFFLLGEILTKGLLKTPDALFIVGECFVGLSRSRSACGALSNRVVDLSVAFMCHLLVHWWLLQGACI